MRGDSKEKKRINLEWVVSGGEAGREDGFSECPVSTREQKERPVRRMAISSF